MVFICLCFLNNECDVKSNFFKAFFCFFSFWPKNKNFLGDYFPILKPPPPPLPSCPATTPPQPHTPPQTNNNNDNK